MRSDERTLLDLLCLAAPMSAELDRAFRLRGSWGQVIQGLRNRGLVAFDGLQPSPSALAEFADRPGDAPAPVLALVPDLRIEPQSDTPATSGPRSSKALDWSPEEDERLRQAYAAGDRIDLVAEDLGRTVRAAMSRSHKIGLGGKHAAGRGGWATDPDWTEAEDEQIRQLYPTKRARALAIQLGRSQRAVYSRAFHLGVKNGWSSGWSDDERRAVGIAHRRGISLTDLATAVGHNYPGVAKFVEKNGFSFGSRPRLAAPLTLPQLLELDDPERPLPRLKPAGRYIRKTAARPAASKLSRRVFPWDQPERQAAFLAALKKHHTINAAVASIGLRGANTQVRKVRARHPEFDRRCAELLDRPAPVTSVWATPGRQDAFVAALQRSGTVKGAFVELGVSGGDYYNRVRVQREADPEFDRRCNEAIAAYEQERLAKPAGDRPRAIRRASAWGTAARQHAFVDALRNHGKIAAALVFVGLGAGSRMGYLRQRERDAAFADRCDEALRSWERGRVSEPACASPMPPVSRRRSVPDLRTQLVVSRETPADDRAKKPGAIRVRGADWAGFSFRSPDRKEAPRRHKSDAEITAENLRYMEERKRIDTCGRRDLSVEEAKLVLQRRGLAVFRSSVTGGRADRWSVAGMGSDVTDAQLVERAERVSA